MTDERQLKGKQDRIEILRSHYGDSNPEVASWDVEHPPEETKPGIIPDPGFTGSVPDVSKWETEGSKTT